ncbi:homeobox domain-domain-containing protein, partial [Syncephalastrum racemosum]
MMASLPYTKIQDDPPSSSINALLNPADAGPDASSASGTTTTTTNDDSAASDISQSHKRQSLRIKSHEEVPVKPKRKRISPEQFQALSQLFEQTDTPNFELREKLAQKLKMTNREVQVWFQNRRAKFNRVRQQQRNQQLQQQQHHQHHQHHHQPSPCDSLSSASSSVSSSSLPTSPYPAGASAKMTPLDILALAADYVQRCDEEE